MVNPDGEVVPGIAPPAKQEGAYVGRLLLRRLTGRPAPGIFQYRNHGNLATVGRKSAIVDFGWMRQNGLSDWLTWGPAHTFSLIAFGGRMVATLSWPWFYFTTEHGARLITGSHRQARSVMRSSVAGTIAAPGYVIASANVGYVLDTARYQKTHQIVPFARIDNLFGLKYIGSVIVDQSSGGSFEPAPGRTFYLGIKVTLRHE